MGNSVALDITYAMAPTGSYWIMRVVQTHEHVEIGAHQRSQHGEYQAPKIVLDV